MKDLNLKPLISLRGIHKSYSTDSQSVDVLHGIDLDIYAGEFVAIMGPSGAGKSTLLHIIGCLSGANGGSYKYKDEEVSNLKPGNLADLRGSEFGFVFQKYLLLDELSLVDNVKLPCLYAGRSFSLSHKRALDLLKNLGLTDVISRKPTQLSGGEQQRVAIARALMMGGSVILADEPTGALDTKNGLEIINQLKRLASMGHTVIMVTHDPLIAAHAERIVTLNDGSIYSDTKSRFGARSNCRIASNLDARKVFNVSVFFSALRSLRSNPFRLILTLLGIIVGVAAVIAMMAIGNGAKKTIVDGIESMGSNLMIVRPGSPNQRGPNVSDTLVPSDADAIQGHIGNISHVVSEQYGGVTARKNNITYWTNINGTTVSFPSVRNWPVASGTFFGNADEFSHAAVAVLGQTVAQILFPDGTSPLGEYVILDNVPFQVIGVMSKKGASPHGTDQDDVIFMPYSTSSARITGKKSLSTISVAVKDLKLIESTEYSVLSLLYDRHKTVDFSVRNVVQIAATARVTQDTFTVMLGLIAAISLLVGGVGVMNIMLVTVTERTKEIGLRMACGASSLDIRLHFMIEAVAISIFGGIIGCIGGLICVALAGAFGTPVIYSLSPVCFAFGCSVVVGVLSGCLPAWRASRLDPVDALCA